MKNLFFLFLLSLIFACSNVKEEEVLLPNVETSPATAEVIKSQLKPYQLTDELFVNSVEAEIYNAGESATYKYMVTVLQDTNSWNDTITFFINKGDTARHLMVFAESESRLTKPASFTATLLKIESK